ncbi:hypothetical protein L249_8175 [Ophiocordyceps polyrhachis-furcata BCC 54312]|uniref:Ubiquitin carboxyl-terminal hydrolase n=1 Tax=Ophiocordyceps polyrhachis-furcata BCC 54312 TaxID=1330021 RepID=A0A367LH42_9HYPO|nr:hypothetical protein L249_8175 [Ophiocordyceps polyrhachis-furcata BCC 54312]
MATSEPSLSHAPEHLVVNLQVVSPSVGVNRPLLFPDLPATTTIKRLKDKIRQTLPLRPSDENQRLIHRGRALLRESDSLLDIFGADALRTLERQTIHLVIRDVIENQQPWTSSNASRGPSPTATATAAARPTSSLHATFGPAPPPTMSRRVPFQTAPHPMSQPRMPSPAPAQSFAEPATQTFQQQHQTMANWMGQVQRDAAQVPREAMFRALVSQGQRGRAHIGMRGLGDRNGSEASSGRVSPGSTHSVHYETIGPNGEVYYVDNVVRVARVTVGGLPAPDGPNGVRNADPAQAAAMTMANALQRTASGPALHSRPFSQPGVTTPILATGGSLAGSGRGTPDANGHMTTVQPQIYLVSSPEGPRALLLNPAAADAYHFPRFAPPTGLPRLRSHSGQSSAAAVHTPQSVGTPQEDQRPQPRNEEEGAAGAAQAQHPVPPVHPNNPAAAALPPLLMQLWPHIWLIFRLGLFVWFFTSPSSSWSRWLTIISLAVFVFVMSTGFLNGMAENAWRPIGRHLENLLPALEQPRLGRAAGENGAGRAGREGDSGPEQMAARLVAEHGARPSWLYGQFRRLERAGLLFLASLAPGVAERHIANLEAEARAEETRRREAAAEAAATTEAGTGDESVSHETLVGEMGNPRQAEREAEREGEDGGQEAARDDVRHEPNRAGGVFTSLVENLGVKGVQFEELLTLEPSELASLQPVYGVIFLFKYPTDRPYATADGPLDGTFDQAASESLFFAAQTIQNACATQALLSLIMNKTDEVEIGSSMSDFRDFTMPLPAEFRGEALSNSDLIRDVHNGFARSSPFVDETQKTGEAEDAFHFIAYLPANGTLYELDGLQPAPISHGPCTVESFPERVVGVLQSRIGRYADSEIRFNLLVMCRDLRMRARDFGDVELLEREERKRRDWMFENALRRHNFVAFSGEVLKGVVRAKMKEGGKEAVDEWVDRSLER